MNIGYQTGQATPEGQGDQHLMLAGPHPVAYASAGKHHFYVSPRDRNNTYDIAWAGLCVDSVLDGGLQIILGEHGATQLAHVPDRWEALSYTPFAWMNLCEQSRGNHNVLATGYQPMWLNNLGYNTYLTKDGFLSEDTNISNALPHQHEEIDIDGDGQADNLKITNHIIQGTNSVYLYTEVSPPPDLCPNDPAQELTDEDGDGLYGKCDPEPLFKNSYVAGGSPEYPSYKNPAEVWLAWKSSGGGLVSRQGYLDRDGDGLVEGEDLCPNTLGGSSYTSTSGNWNRWGEEINFPRADNATKWASVSAADEGVKTLGAMYRGNSCDPYPSLSLDWSLPSSSAEDSGGACQLTEKKTVGVAGTPPLKAKLTVGLSENDPTRNNPQPPRTYNVQTYRCACDHADCLRGFLTVDIC